jgi:hypothetical protein
MSSGSWVQNHPRPLEWLYHLAESIFLRLDPVFRWIGYDRVEALMRPAEDLFKKLVFDCQVCGQCVLHYTGMTCPMTCPKRLRNGPCGGVRPDGHCEVDAEEWCVWYRAWERSRKMKRYGDEILDLQPMHDWLHEDTSAWVNMLREEHGELQR